MSSDWLSEAIQHRRPFHLGELHVEFHGDDAIVSVPADGDLTSVPGTPAALREWTRTDDHGIYRPLSGAVGMRRGWSARIPVQSLGDALEAIYPLARRHIAMAAEGSLRTATTEEVLGRQSGRYEPVRRADHETVRIVREELCGGCVRTPFWRDPGAPVREGAIPCPEPCSVFVALARDLVVLDHSPAPAEPDDSIQFAAFEEPGNPTRERCLARLRAAR